MIISPLLIVLAFGGIALSAGIVLAPALPIIDSPARQNAAPRIGLAASLALAIIVVGALFWTAIVGWHTVIIDYLWFPTLIAIVIIGFITFRQKRGAASRLNAPDAGWPGPREWVFFAVIMVLFIAPVLVLPVPLDTDAQGFGYLALMLRESGSMTTLAPFNPEIEFLYSHGFLALAAYLSQTLGIALHTVQSAASAVLAVIFVWTLYDLGNEVEDWLRPPVNSNDSSEKPARYAGAILAGMSIIGVGLFTAYMDSHYTTIMALVFSLAFLMFIVRFLRGSLWIDALAAAVCLAAVPITHPDTTIILALGYGPWLLVMGLAKPRPALRQWLTITIAVPLTAVILIIPWLLTIAPLMGSDIASPFVINIQHWKALVFFHGGVIIPFVIGGVILAVRRRSPLDLLMLVWLVAIIEFSTLGILEHVIPTLLEPLLKYDYPFSIAWHGPIIPYAYLSTSAIIWLAGRIGWGRVRRWTNKLAWPVLGLATAGIVLGVIFADPILGLSKGRITFYGAFSSHADVRAMDWLRENTPPDTRILNHPEDQEGDWVPVISERDTIFYRPQPFFQHTAQSEEEQAALRGFWVNPADPAWADILAQYDVAYVIVPQVVGDSDSFATMWRWQEPFAWRIAMQSSVADAPYLTLVIDFDGAQIYAVNAD